MVRNRNSGSLAEAPPHYHGHRERLRERFRNGGSDALADYELLELVLFRAQPRRDMKPLAKSLIDKFGSFAEAIAAPPERLAEIEGLGETTICDLKVIEAAARRLAHGAVKRRAVLSSWSAVLDYCRAAMAFADKEQFRICYVGESWVRMAAPKTRVMPIFRHFLHVCCLTPVHHNASFASAYSETNGPDRQKRQAPAQRAIHPLGL
jgi:hypothetical protein